MKYLITDPCYIISHADWDALCDQATKQEKEQGRDWCDTFHDLVAAHLRTISGNQYADACGTGYGDWTNYMFGRAVKQSEFGADSGMVCMVELTDKLTEYINGDKENSVMEVMSLSAVLESDDVLHAEFNTDNPNWTELCVLDSRGSVVAYSEPYETEDEDEDEDAEEEE